MSNLVEVSFKASQPDPLHARLDYIRDLSDRKKAGYVGPVENDRFKNFRLSEELGVPAALGAAVRMGDKWARFVNLIKDSNADQVGESVHDTLIDLATYALIVDCLLSEDDPKGDWVMRYLEDHGL